jgi:sugar-specific transcriptional regulator TrmB
MEYGSLEEIGFTRSEIKVYLALIELGESTVGNIVKKSGVASSKIYELLEKLMEKGIVSTYIKANRKYFQAANPKRLKDYIEQRKKELHETGKEIEDMIPLLSEKFLAHAKETEVELFKGYRGVETVFRDMIRELKKGDEFLVCGGGDSPTENERTKWFFEKIHRQRSEKGIVLRIILSEARRKSMKQITLFPCTNQRYTDVGTPSTTNIYGDTTILLIMSPYPAAIRIRNKQITETYRKYFEELWTRAKK